MKNNKSAGPDNILTERIKTAGEAGNETMTEMANITLQKTDNYRKKMCQFSF